MEEEKSAGNTYMKKGDEDLVEDEGNTIVQTTKNKTNYDTSDIREDVNMTESTNEQKVTGQIPMLKNNKNALIRN